MLITPNLPCSCETKLGGRENKIADTEFVCFANSAGKWVCQHVHGYLCVFFDAENGDDSSSDESTPSPATEGR